MCYFPTKTKEKKKVTTFGIQTDLRKRYELFVVMPENTETVGIHSSTFKNLCWSFDLKDSTHRKFFSEPFSLFWLTL